MSLKLYNTLTAQLEPFVPRQEGRVGMYVCGTTVYDFSHIGHAKVYVTWDTLRRYLIYRGFQVTYVQNFTDIDDKIIKRAAENGESTLALSERFIDAYFEDFKQLNVLPADVHPKATEYVPQMVAHIQGLIDKGMAYATETGNVYFRVSRFSDYGKLSKKHLEDLEAGARVEGEPDKENSLDFALWKTSKPGEPTWDSPWGAGRPGWHIECSAMSRHHLGDTFDIHAGGLDLIFPHHENEIAQSEGLTGQQMVKYWLHNAFVLLDSEKMSKSTNRFVYLRDLLAHYPGEVIRLYLLQNITVPVDFNDIALTATQEGLEHLRRSMAQVLEKTVTGSNQPEAERGVAQAWEAFEAGFIRDMDNDFNTPEAVGSVFQFVKTLHPMAATAATATQDAVQRLKQLVRDVLGLSLDMVQQQLTDALSPQLMALLIDLRQQARQEKNWALSDQIRDRLKAIGVELQDKPGGRTAWEYQAP